MSGNKAYFGDGSGIKLSSGSLTINGGNVSGNIASEEPYEEPLGIGVYTSGSFTMNGGTLTDKVYQARGNAVLLGGEIVSYRWNAGSVSLGIYDQKASSVVIDNLYMANKRINVYGKFSGTIYVSTDKRPTAAGDRIRLTALGDSRAEVSEANILSFDPTIDTAKIDGEIYFMAPRTEVSLILDRDEYYPGAAFPEITLNSAKAKINGVWVDVPGKLYWLDPPETAPIAYYGTSYKYVFEPDDNLTYKIKIGSISLAPIAVTKIEAKLSGDFPTKLYTDTAPEIMLPYITVTRTWASGRVDTLTTNEFTISLPLTFVAGANAIGIRSEACKKTYTTTVTVTVIEVVTTGIDVEFRQSQNLFVETRVSDYPAIFGDDLKVWLNYNSGKRERISDYVISPQPRYTGSQELSIIYGEYSQPINVYIRGVSLSGIEGIFSDSGRSRVRTDFTLDELKPYVTARYIYNNGSYGDAVDFSTGNFKISYPKGVSGLQVGYNTLKISFYSTTGGVLGKTYDGTVQIPAVEVESFEVTVDQKDFIVFTTIEPQSLKTLLGNDLKITANYNDGTTENVTNKVTLSGDFSVSGDVTITLGAQAATGTFAVTLTQPVLMGITASIEESGSYRLWTTDTLDEVKEKLPLIVRATYVR